MKLGALANAIGARLLGDPDVDVTRVRSVDESAPTDVGFAASARELKDAFVTKAAAILVDEGWAAEHAHELPCAVLASPHASRSLALAIEALYPRELPGAGVHARAVVEEGAHVDATAHVGALAVVARGARVEKDAIVAPLAYVGEGVVVGAGASIGVGAVVLAGTSIGARVVVGPGSVVGDEGFVYAPDGDANVVVRHVAGVHLGDDVEVGANACIDRGALRDTRVGAGTKIDNLAQIGHDVVVGEHAVIIAQVGIAGDARIGDGAVLAGQAGVKERVVVGKRARVAGQAGVTRDVDDGAAVSGMPAIPHMTWLRAMTRLQHLEELEKRVRTLEKRLAHSEEE